MRYIKQIRNFIFPSYCLYCRVYISPDLYLCQHCEEEIQQPIAYKMTIGKLTLTVHAVSSYCDPLKSLILAKGYSDYRASKALGSFMWHKSALQKIPFDLVVPTPLHWTRYAVRGYNQTEVMADEISRLSGKPTMQLLKRVKRTQAQSSLTPVERKLNISHAFRLVTPDYGKGKIIVLVDDLMTTGATLCDAAQELIKCEPKELYAIVACRVLK